MAAADVVSIQQPTVLGGSLGIWEYLGGKLQDGDATATGAVAAPAGARELLTALAVWHYLGGKASEAAGAVHDVSDDEGASEDGEDGDELPPLPAPVLATGAGGAGSAQARVDEAQQLREDEEKGKREGAIRKRGAKFPHTWKVRHAVLSARGLDYYDHDGGTLKGTLRISGTSTVGIRSRVHSNARGFRLECGNKELLAQGMTDKETEAWVEAIEAAIRVQQKKPRRFSTLK